ncbi:MAG: trypsin-like peptidase domain-containing protein [Solirubrobacteraceae bacterium]
MNNNIKKTVTYFLVGISSALCTIGVYNYVNKDFLAEKNNYTNYNHFASSTNPQSNITLPDLTTASEESVHAVVSIKNLSSSSGNGAMGQMDPFDFFFGFPNKKDNREKENNEPTERGQGSGVIIASDGYIVTNNHVIEGAEKLEVVLNNQEKYIATVVGSDKSTDIALLKIDAKNLPFLKFLDSDKIKVGEWVLAVGNPFGLNSTVTAGIVSAKGRSIDILRNNSDSPIESFIQTDAAINPGNSGGALVNVNSDLVGINTAIQSPTGSYSGYGFAVPSNLVKKIVEDIKQYGVVQRGFIGINGLDLSNEQLVKSYNQTNKTSFSLTQGVLITGLTEDGGAIEAGLEKHDIITKVEGKPIKSFSMLTFIVGNKRPGDVVAVTVLRKNKEKTYNITLRDKKGKTKIRTKSDLSVSEKLGAEFKDLTAYQKQRFGIDHGVIVINLTGGKLTEIGIQENFIILKVNDKKIVNSKDIEEFLKNFKGNVSVNYVDNYGRVYTGGFNLD